MLLIPMYHRVVNSRYNCNPHVFSQHLHAVAEQFPIVVPGEPLPKKKLAVCLTFDDAFFDFYHVVFPLLKQLNIKAVLAVPVKYILAKTNADIDTRLSRPENPMQAGVYDQLGTYCTWAEIQEMAASGHVIIASHAYHHLNINKNTIDYNVEVVQSKTVLAEKTNQAIESFVYPHGNMSAQFHQQVCQHYRYAMRIGSAMNSGWSQLLYRFDAEHFWPFGKMWRAKDYRKLFIKMVLNKVRNK